MIERGCFSTNLFHVDGVASSSSPVVVVEISECKHFPWLTDDERDLFWVKQKMLFLLLAAS